jgi:signal peptidase I
MSHSVIEARARGKRPPVGSAGASLIRSVVEIVLIVGAALVLALLIQQFVVKPFSIPSGSMEPTLVQGDRILVARFAYRFGDPKPGDVVVFDPPTARKEEYVKRVVAVAGDTVSVHDGKLYVNGEPMTEPYLKDANLAGTFPEITVPKDMVFVMGDNRNNSADGRVFGPVPKSSILGRVFAIYWPLNRIQGV